MTDQELIDYYVATLIIQYRNKPKARAHIAAIAKQLAILSLIDSVKNAYNLETAVGKQLDVIGEYEGIDRFYRWLELENYFSFTDYSETDPDSENKYGFSTYSDYDDDSFNGTLTYADIISQLNTLLDDSYRTLIKLKIVQNYTDHTAKSIDDGIYSVFGTEITMDDPGLMHIVYFINTALTPIIKAAIYKKVLPKPMAVGLIYVTDMEDETFCFSSYDQDAPSNGYGFSAYSVYTTQSGQFLNYDQINKG